MLNPITYTEKVIGDFLRYQITAYPFADSDLYAQMRALLNLEETRATPLMKGPYISLSRSFETGAAVVDLVAEGVLHPHLTNTATHPNTFGHQERAIRAITAGQHTLLSTGTGSGKTEAFLYPIISRCLTLRDQHVGPGIVAVIVYPMNALAEDQLGRLRELLAGSGVTFGMYIGKTPDRLADAGGYRLPRGSSRADYLATLTQFQKEKRTDAVHPPEERVSREEMRTPGQQPRILLTNVKQLELLLTRQVDVDLFQNAQLDFLVFDEAHTYSGAGGAETACLIRRLRAFCGRSANQTVCIATSATIVDPERGPDAGRDFACRFFGVDPDNVALIGEQYEPDRWAEDRTLPSPPTGNIATYLANVLEAVEFDDPGPAVKQILKAINGVTIDEATWQESLYDSLSANELVYQIAEALQQPRSLSDLIADLSQRIGRPVSEEETLIWLALGAASRREERPLLRPVVHAFVRGVGGAVVTFPESQDRPRLWLSAGDIPFGKEAEFHLPIMSCTTCGQHYFIHHLADFHFTDQGAEGGQQVQNGRVWQALDAAQGGKRAVLLDHLVSDEDNDQDDDGPVAIHNTLPMYFCRYCGALHPDKATHCDGCGRPDSLTRLYVVRQRPAAEGYLSACVACGAIGHRAMGGYREPARPVRATTVSDVHVLAQNMLHRAERKRLLVFADNRQDAAFQAGWMRDHARRFRLRSLMYERIVEGPISIGDLTAHLDDLLEDDDDLSRTLVPEVWRTARKEAEGVRHRRERKYFLRIQVLRELVTGVKQRIGLEPWGRIVVNYRGLTPDRPFILDWAKRLDLTPEAVCNGTASLLDVARRNYILLDRDHQVFSRTWSESDREILNGYLPLVPGVPKGLKLSREPNDHRQRVQQWLATTNHLTSATHAVRRWGVPPADMSLFFEELWQLLVTDLELLVPVQLTGWRNRAVPGTVGVFQIDADRIYITPDQGVYRCNVCRRAHPRPTPKMACLAYRCNGTLVLEEERPDDYDLMVLDQQFSMLRPREHSAQVPAEEREILERMFKGDSQLLNTLVATPTLELGVDIGALDIVLMRNVPPLPANYWQRAGRAGRRHRMAVNITYARPASHDRAYYEQPLKLLLGTIYPPRINLRNELMVEKHIHAAILTVLNQLRKDQSADCSAREQIGTILAHCFPTFIRDYLFDEQDNVRLEPLDVSSLNSTISAHKAAILQHVTLVFSQTTWPAQDAPSISQDRLEESIDNAGQRLQQVIQRLWKRLNWALDQMKRLEDVRRPRGTLEPAEDALYQRCKRLVNRYKGVQTRRRQETEGYDDTYTYSVLAAEGFLPGYGLDTGSVIGTAQLSYATTARSSDFDLPRAPGIALREYAPGNYIYANGNRYIPRFYHLEPEDPTEFMVDITYEAVTEVGTAPDGIGLGLGASALPAVQICDVDMPHVSQITDDEDYRFQLAVSVIGHERDRHDGGDAYHWQARDLQHRRNVHLRLVNVGAAQMVTLGQLGYPVCLVCGQSRSPFASQTDQDQFAQDHQGRCGEPIHRVGFFADVIADALSLPDCADRSEAYSVAEALRMGAANVLEMDLDDLQILTIGHPGVQSVDALLYDPMPGGSGLLEQMISRWGEVVTAALNIVDNCASACTVACIDCLYTYRNAFYHRYLDRHVASERLATWGTALQFSHTIPIRMSSVEDTSGEMPVNQAEVRLLSMIQRAGFPTPAAQHAINLGRPLGTTTPDFFYNDHQQDQYEGVCIYLDGMSRHIHGNPQTRQRDRHIREELRNREYEVIEIPYGDMTDRDAMTQHFYRLGRILLGRAEARQLRDDPQWFCSDLE